MRRSFLYALVTLLAAAGCSLLGLDEVEVTPCLVSPTATTSYLEAHATCERELGGAPLDECEAWVCALRVGDELFCVVGAPDRDGDGVGDAMCIPEGDDRLRDCDDDDPLRAEGRAERCDGRDNDCNGLVDDGLLTRMSPRRVDEADGAAGQVAWGEGVAALRRAVMGQQRLFTWSGSGAPQPLSGGVTLFDPAVAAEDPGLAVAPTEEGVVAVFARNLPGCPRTLVAASIRGGVASGNTLETGLPDDAGRNCESTPRRDEWQRAPSIAALGRRRVLTWIAGQTPAGPLRIVGGTDANGLTLADTAQTLGNAIGRVALLALPDEDYVLAAIPRSGRVGVHRIELSAAGAVSVSDQLTSISAEVVDLALAGGPADASRRALALVYRTGEGRGARTILQRLTLDRGTGTIERGAPSSIGGGEGQAAPAVAFSDAPRAWIVTWTEGAAALVAQQFGEHEGVTGAPLRLVDEAALGRAPELRFGGAIATTATGLVARTHVNGATGGIYELALGCGDGG